MKKKIGFLLYIGIIVLLVAINGEFVKRERIQREQGKKNHDIMELLKQWLLNMIKGYSVEKYFVDNGYKTVAIYGMGQLGELLYRELSRSSITVKYAIDRNSSHIFEDIEIINPNDDYADVDVFVVTPINDAESIIGSISSKTNRPIITIEDILYNDSVCGNIVSD